MVPTLKILVAHMIDLVPQSKVLVEQRMRPLEQIIRAVQQTKALVSQPNGEVPRLTRVALHVNPPVQT